VVWEVEYVKRMKQRESIEQGLRVASVSLESNIDLGKSALRGEFPFSDGGLSSSSLGPISNDWLDNFFELFEDGGAGDRRFNERGVCRS